jgi:hypothetical protein
MVTTLPWLWLLGAGVALVVGLIAFLVASGLTESRPHSTERPGSGRRRTDIRRAS